MTGQRTLYVSAKGSDESSGNSPKPICADDGPLATLDGALEKVRASSRAAESPVEIRLLPGLYPLRSPIQLSAESIDTDARIVVKGSGARLIGGRIVRGFHRVKDPHILSRLPPKSRDHVRQLDLMANGVSDLGQMRSRGFGRPLSPSHLELFFGGRRMQLARWPNKGFAKISRIVEELPEGDGHGAELGRLESGFILDDAPFDRWGGADGVWAHGYWAWDWANTYEKVDSIECDTGRVTTRPPYGQYGFRAGQRVYFLNLLEELDSPGEYYVDKGSGILYFWPPSDPDKRQAVVSVFEEPLIRLDGVEGVVFEGLTLGYGRYTGFDVVGGSDVVIAGCTVHNMGSVGIAVRGGSDHKVTSCEVYGTGDAGISVEGGDRRKLEPAGHVVENCHIHHFGEWSRTYQPGVRINGVGITVSHSLIHDGPHNAILLNGNENVVEFNHIHHVCKETGDVGAFYMGRDWTQRGTTVRHNLFHDTRGVGMGSMAIYLDDCASGARIYGNVFYRCTRAVFIGGGRDNVVENNMFFECDPAVMIDGRGLDLSPVWHGMVHRTMKALLDDVDHHSPPYSLKYPELADLDPYYSEAKGVPPEGNAVIRNVCTGGEWLVIHWHARSEMMEIRDNVVDGDLLLRGGKLVLAEGSRAVELGFRDIPVDQIGLFADHYRSEKEVEKIRSNQRRDE